MERIIPTMVTDKTKPKGRKSGRRTQAASSKSRSNHVRLSKEESQKREAFAREFFRKNPEATGTSLNKAFADKKEPMMNIAKVYAIRAEVRAQAVGHSAPQQATGTNGAGSAPPVIPAAEFENARQVAGANVRGKGGVVLPFAKVKEEAGRLWRLMQASGVQAATIVEGKVHLTGKYQLTEELV